MRRRQSDNYLPFDFKQLIAILTCITLCVGLVSFFTNKGIERGRDQQKLEDVSAEIVKINSSIRDINLNMQDWIIKVTQQITELKTIIQSNGSS